MQHKHIAFHRASVQARGQSAAAARLEGEGTDHGLLDVADGAQALLLHDRHRLLVLRREHLVKLLQRRLQVAQCLLAGALLAAGESLDDVVLLPPERVLCVAHRPVHGRQRLAAGDAQRLVDALQLALDLAHGLVVHGQCIAQDRARVLDGVARRERRLRWRHGLRGTS